ncbi:unnamed protein product [Adineta steineri]|uniref:Uncharacterized protein n=1 Tax=Adineta steineri TaxID=433720 RepID=A0A814UI37_9BILA|nr:unnamed protein product [Adineta steineri]CAF1175996.1 unnamed protein product [Adineta steineri]
MTDIPPRPKSIFIRLHDRFDSRYPRDLYGIINPDEFQESMNRINHPILSKKKNFYIISIISLFLVTLGICLIIAAKTTANPNSEIGALMIIGILTIHLGLWPSCIACCLIHYRRDRKLIEAVEKESIKYSCRSPTPCGWRLESPNYTTGRYENEFSNLVIDIGRSMIAESEMCDSNQVTPISILLSQHQDNSTPPSYSQEDDSVSISLFQHQDDTSSPPPYSAQIPRFCSQCNAPRPDLTTKFCSFCGHSFDKYQI